MNGVDNLKYQRSMMMSKTFSSAIQSIYRKITFQWLHAEPWVIIHNTLQNISNSSRYFIKIALSMSLSMSLRIWNNKIISITLKELKHL